MATWLAVGFLACYTVWMLRTDDKMFPISGYCIIILLSALIFSCYMYTDKVVKATDVEVTDE
jgi:hypothetical protein